MLDIFPTTKRVFFVAEQDEWLVGSTESDPSGIEIKDFIINRYVLESLFEENLTLSREKIIDQKMKLLVSAFGKYFQIFPEKALLDFYSLSPGPEVAREYIEKYGLFRNEDLDLRPDSPKEIQKFLSNDFSLPSFALRLDDFWKEHATLKGLIDMHRKLKSGDKAGADRIAQEFRTPSAFDFMSTEIPHRLQHCELCLKYINGTLHTTLESSHVLGGLYAHFWNLVNKENYILECPKCRKSFSCKNLSKKYCSLSCQQASKQKRYRERDGEGKKQKRGNE